VEDRLAREWGEAPGEVLLDFPAKPEMLAAPVPVITRRDVVAPAHLSIQRVAEDLHRGARRFRIYAAHPVSPSRAAAVLPLLDATADQVRGRLAEDRPLAPVSG
jgi:hypothetical protein